MAPQVVLSTPRPGPQRKDATVDSTRSVTVGDGILYAESGPPKYSPRAERALALYEERGHDIRRIGENLYRVPSCSGTGFYDVLYGGEHEECPCPDFQFGRGRHACKHLIATALLFAARRSGVKEIRISSTIAGDPMAHAGKRRAKTASCDGCGRRFVIGELVVLGEDNHDGLTHFDGDRLCRSCADAAGVSY
jgi:hypothetical protein